MEIAASKKNTVTTSEWKM